jgi:hypothetical protein
MVDRRNLVTFDPDHFGKQGAPPDPLTAFRYAHLHNLWGGSETPSGPGSSLHQTAELVRALPALFRRLGIRRLLDIPCGEFHWMSRVDLNGVAYVGGDLVPEVIQSTRANYPARAREFVVMNLMTSDLPAADLLLCRDCLVHLSTVDIAAVIENVRRAGIPYLLTTTFTNEVVNQPIVTGDWRPINLEVPPFGFPVPKALIVEGCTEQDGMFADKSLGLWRVEDLPRIPSGSA